MIDRLLPWLAAFVLLVTMISFAFTVSEYMVAWAIPPYAVIGGFLAIRRPRNPVGWLLLGASAVLSIGGAIENILFIVAVPLTAALFGGFLLVFPTGKLPSPRWRTIAWALITCALGNIAFGSGSDEPSAIGRVFIALLLLSLLACLSAPFWRFRRASGVERTQLRWMATATATTLAAFVLAVATNQLGVGIVSGFMGLLGFAGFMVAIPISIAIAVLRYRLYELDRIVSRGVTYSIVVGLLLAAYGGVVTILGQVLPFDSSLAVAASTLTAAALFNPLRRRVQRSVDRRFSRTRYIAQRELEGFTSRHRSTSDMATLQADLVASVRKTLEPSVLTLWIRTAAAEAGDSA